MKHFSKFAVLAVAAVFFSRVPAAHADAMYGDLSVTVWNGPGVDYTAALPTPSGTPTATFNYSGPLNFVNNSGQNTANTFADFFNSNGSTNYTSDISNFSSSDSWSQFLNLTMSTPGEKYPAINTYMLFTGTYSANGSTNISVSHDDGASLYYYDGQTNSWIDAVSSAAPTSDVATKGTLIEGTNVPFDLTYVESNGAPSDMVVNGLSPVPESSSIVLMSLGMIGILGLMYRRQAWNA